MKLFFAYRHNGGVACYSDKEETYKNLQQVGIEVSSEEIKMIEDGWELEIKDGKLHCYEGFAKIKLREEREEREKGEDIIKALESLQENKQLTVDNLFSALKEILI